MFSYAIKIGTAGAVAIGLALFLRTDFAGNAVEFASSLVRQEYRGVSVNTFTDVSISGARGDFKESQLVPFQNCAFESEGKPSYAPIVFYEIAWMGDDARHTNEWMSLKMAGGSEVNISGWQVVNQNERIRIVIPQGTVVRAEKPVYVLARNMEIAGVDADLTFSGAIRNEKEGLRLFDNNCAVIDEVLADPQWPGGDNNAKQPMKRRADLSWGTAGVTEEARDPADEIAKENEKNTAPDVPSDTREPREERAENDFIEEGAVFVAVEPEAPSPKLDLVAPLEINGDGEFAVRVSAAHLAYGMYDIKIFLFADGITNMSDVYDQTQGSWQSSFYYLQEYFTGESLSQEFTLRVRDAYRTFSGDASLSVRVRESGKSVYLEDASAVRVIGGEPLVSEQSSEPEDGATESASELKININTASYEVLQDITGVGPTIAQRIIDYRNEHGLFQQIEDIKNVKGIGDATFEKMKDEITI